MKIVKYLLLIGLSIFLLVMLLGIFLMSDPDYIDIDESTIDSMEQVVSDTIIENEVTENRDERIKKQFSGWDGSHLNLTKYIKENMNDEDSYKHISTVYYDEGDGLLVITKFSGKNAFGGKVKQTITARVDLDGNVTEIVMQK